MMHKFNVVNIDTEVSEDCDLQLFKVFLRFSACQVLDMQRLVIFFNEKFSITKKMSTETLMKELNLEFMGEKLVSTFKKNQNLTIHAIGNILEKNSLKTIIISIFSWTFRKRVLALHENLFERVVKTAREISGFEKMLTP